MKPTILAILDGWGISDSSLNNAIKQANLPHLKEAEKNYPHCALQASGIAVGLPWNEPGNSEVGHLVIGSGRIVYQYLPRISLEIKDGRFFQNPALVKTIKHVQKNNSALHLLGLVSSGTVHSYLEHLYALLELGRQNNIKKIYLHCFTDGKDAPLKEGVKIISAIQEKLKNPDWKISTIIGRYYAMDRNHNYDRTEIAYNSIVNRKGETTTDPIAKIKEFYDQDITDTFLKPIVVVDENQLPIGNIKDNDGLIFFNFRNDSMQQLVKMFVKDNFSTICTMTEYEKDLPVEVAYPPIEIKNHLTQLLSDHNKKVLKIAETEKYAHVTYFFNGGIEKPYTNEFRKLIPSKIVTHYDDYPQMQAEEITKTVINKIEENYDLIVVNYANADMIGHTGNLKAGIKAAECLDQAIQPLIDLAEKDKCILILTSDHGNLEDMINLRTGEIATSHSIYPVPFYLVGKEFKKKRGEEISSSTPQGMLCDVAPTILAIMHIPQPLEMTGQSLLDVLK